MGWRVRGLLIEKMAELSQIVERLERGKEAELYKKGIDYNSWYMRENKYYLNKDNKIMFPFP